MLHVVLFEPEIPPNTGNIIRLCANTGFTLHLIEPMGFVLNDKKLRRAGLDYREWTQVHTHPNFASCQRAIGQEGDQESPDLNNYYTLSTKGTRIYSDASFRAGDVLVFGPETRGLPTGIREQFGHNHVLTLPMAPDSRSLNLSNAVAIVVYEAWRQLNYIGSAGNARLM